jgi:hypothetical protein
MTYRRNLSDAEREASDLNVRESAQSGQRMYRYQAQRYSTGDWGIGRYVCNYYKDGSERFDGFVWKAIGRTP